MRRAGYAHLSFRIEPPTPMRLTARARTALHLWLVPVLCAAHATGAAGQVRTSGGIDVAWSPSHVWRGLVLSERQALAAAGFAQVARADHVLTAGAWTAVQAGRAGTGRRTLRQGGRSGVAEVDLWAQYTRRLPRMDASLGLVRYLFPGLEGVDRTEAYAQLWPAGLPVDVRGTVFVELAPRDAAYAELEASRSLSLLPLPWGPPALVVSGTAGWSLAAPPADSPRPATLAAEGLTHLEMGLMLVFPVYRVTAHGGVRGQYGFDPVAPTDGAPQPSRRARGELGVSVAFGSERRAP
jgi:hypothetical protein